MAYKWTPSAQRVTGGGTYRFTTAAAQYVADVAAVNAAKASILNTMTLLTVTGTYDAATAIAAAVAAQLAADVAAVTAEADAILSGTTILGVSGTYVLPWNASADPNKDPLTRAYETLWVILESDPNFALLVKARNRIKYTDDLLTAAKAPRYPERDSRQPQDYPQVRIVPVGGPSEMYCSSDGTRITERFQIQVNTGDRRLCYAQDGIYQGLFPVQWAILRAMMNWEDRLKELTWNSKVYVHHCSVSNRDEKVASPRLEEQDAPVKDAGWTVAWQGDLEAWFTSADLAA